MDAKQKFGERFTEAVKLRNLHYKNNKDLGRMIGVSGTMANNYLNGVKLPSMETAIKIAVLLGVDVNWLLTGQSTGNQSIENEKLSDLKIAHSAMNLYPIIEWADIQKWSSSGMETGIKPIEYRRTNLEVSAISFWLEVVSDNMLPEFNKGDKVLIDPNLTATNNDFVLVDLGDGSHGLRQLIVDAGSLYIKSVNQDWPTKLAPLCSMDKIKGMVAEKAQSYIK